MRHMHKPITKTTFVDHIHLQQAKLFPSQHEKKWRIQYLYLLMTNFSLNKIKLETNPIWWKLTWAYVYIPKKVFATFVVPSFLVHVMVFYNMDYVFFIEISINTPTLASSIACWWHLNMACPQQLPTNGANTQTLHMKQLKLK